MAATKRRIMKKDFDTVADYIVSEMQRRKGSDWRRKHERVWRELDRQIAMEAPQVRNRDDDPNQDWHSAIQLGELADASEILAADIMRLAFPNDRKWFSPHVDLPLQVDPETGDRVMDTQEQRTADEVLRSLMAQQHLDFGLRDRVKLSVKEALHHGGFVAEVRWEQQPRFHGTGRMEMLGCATWRPYSMWDCYPDPSPQVIGTDLFYSGSMIIKRKMKPHTLREQEGWRNKEEALRGIRDGQDVDLLLYYGDLHISRKNGNDIWLPNRRVIIAEKNKQFLFSEENQTPFSPIIYTGYEKDDVRDPYYTSPIVKRSPMHALATHYANKFSDGVDMWVEPPVAYDRNDPAMRDGPPLYPGAKVGTQSTGSVKEIRIGDPGIALTAMQFATASVQRGTGVDAVRSGVSSGTEQTATEVVKADQKSEIRVVDFVGTLERQGMSAYLYMQHFQNKRNLRLYPFFNTEIHTPDFLRASKEDLPDTVRFDVTGSRQLLGEEQRTARFMNATGFVAQSEALAGRVDLDELIRQIFADTGQKDPERFLKIDDGPTPEMQQMMMQFEQMQQQFQQQMQQMTENLQKTEQDRIKAEMENRGMRAQIQEEQARVSAKDDEIRSIRAESRAEKAQMKLEIEQMEAEQIIRDRAEEARSALEQQQGTADESAPAPPTVVAVGGGQKVIELDVGGRRVTGTVSTGG